MLPFYSLQIQTYNRDQTNLAGFLILERMDGLDYIELFYIYTVCIKTPGNEGVFIFYNLKILVFFSFGHQKSCIKFFLVGLMNNFIMFTTQPVCFMADTHSVKQVFTSTLPTFTLEGYEIWVGTRVHMLCWASSGW